MRELGKQKRLAFYGRFLDRELRVLLEDRREKETGRWKGFSRNYIPVVVEDGQDCADRVNREWSVTVTRISDHGAVGKIG